MSAKRYSTGYARLDQALGGGIIPGVLTLVLGSSGVGKTHLGVSFAAGTGEKDRGLILDMTARGDSQDHAEYAARMAGWNLRQIDVNRIATSLWDAPEPPGDIASLLRDEHRKVIRGQVDEREWLAWNAFIQKRMQDTAMLIYSAFVGGRRRVVVDGIEPSSDSSQSIQREFFDHCVERMIKKDAVGLAMDAFRERFYQNKEKVEAAAYDHKEVATIALVTSQETMLDALMARPLEAGDLFAVANTVILMGWSRRGDGMERGLFVAKHRGSACSSRILPFEVGEKGLIFN